MATRKKRAKGSAASRRKGAGRKAGRKAAGRKAATRKSGGRKSAGSKSATRKTATRKAATRKSPSKKTAAGKSAAKKSAKSATKRKRSTSRGRGVAAAVQEKARQGLDVAREGFDRLRTTTTNLVEEVKERIGGSDEPRVAETPEDAADQNPRDDYYVR